MLRTIKTPLNPRKSPVQARSAASVEALLEATVQVLLEQGQERLTTTRVAARAGVSVGTLYQYFPNKSALLHAVLERHLQRVADAVETACGAQHGASLDEMARAVVGAFLAAKMRNARMSVALYAISADLDGARIRQETGRRTNRAIAAMLRSSPQPIGTDPVVAAWLLQDMLGGVSRRILESGAPARQLESVRADLIRMASAYLRDGAAR